MIVGDVLRFASVGDKRLPPASITVPDVPFDFCNLMRVVQEADPYKFISQNSLLNNNLSAVSKLFRFCICKNAVQIIEYIYFLCYNPTICMKEGKIK